MNAQRPPEGELIPIEIKIPANEADFADYLKGASKQEAAFFNGGKKLSELLIRSEFLEKVLDMILSQILEILLKESRSEEPCLWDEDDFTFKFQLDETEIKKIQDLISAILRTYERTPGISEESVDILEGEQEELCYKVIDILKVHHPFFEVTKNRKKVSTVLLNFSQKRAKDRKVQAKAFLKFSQIDEARGEIKSAIINMRAVVRLHPKNNSIERLAHLRKILRDGNITSLGAHRPRQQNENLGEMTLEEDMQQRFARLELERTRGHLRIVEDRGLENDEKK